MDQLKPKNGSSNVNVMLASEEKARPSIYDRELPCPLCGTGMPIRISKKVKPYCRCDDCGIQLFIRGKSGILRLWDMARDGILVKTKEESASHAILLINRLEQLNLQKEELEAKRGIIFPDKNVENAMEIVDQEIKSIQSELDRRASANRRIKNLEKTQ